MDAIEFLHLQCEEFSCLLVSQALLQSKPISLGPKLRPILQALPHILNLRLCGSSYNHPQKFSLSFVLESPYQPFIAACLASSSTQDSFFSCRMTTYPSKHVAFPSQVVLPDLVQQQVEQVPKKLYNYGGKQTFPLEISQFFL